MKVCLVSFVSPYAIPYINIYLNEIERVGATCDILYWDRDCSDTIETRGSIRYVPYSGKAQQSSGKLSRYAHYVPATRHVRRYLKSESYDRVVFLQTHAAVACEKILKNLYAGRYIVDIRDYTLEGLKPFFDAEKRVIDMAYQTVISSEGYKQFLPEHKYMVVHNCTPVDEEIAERIRTKPVKTKGINICFIGYVRFYDMAQKIISVLKNDERFHVSYIGTGADALEPFCREHGIENVTLKGKFTPDETPGFYLNCDIVNNLYGNHNKYLDYALSNKLYYGAQFNIPVLVSGQTYSCQVAEKYNIGFSWNVDGSNAADDLYENYMNFDREKMKTASNQFLQGVLEDNERFKAMIRSFLSAGGIS